MNTKRILEEKHGSHLNPRFLAYLGFADLKETQVGEGEFYKYSLWIGKMWRLWANSIGRDGLECLNRQDHANFDKWLFENLEGLKKEYLKEWQENLEIVEKLI